jgi:glycine dehydrogenase subunit 1
VVQHPNAFGNVEQVDDISRTIHVAGGLFIAIVDPISLGILKRPVEYDADIVVAEGQPLGIPMNFGGPYLGILACREALLRRIPGRIVGETVDRRGNRCWVLTMQTREQHIRREKASSNICSNQGLMAVRASIYLALLGANGLREIANLCTQKAHYLAQQLVGKTQLKLTYPDAVFFKEFMVSMPNNSDATEFCNKLVKQKIFAGIPYGNNILIAVTEKRTKEEMDYFVEQVNVCL